jgi:hypothetical protein
MMLQLTQQIGKSIAVNTKYIIAMGPHDSGGTILGTTVPNEVLIVQESYEDLCHVLGAEDMQGLVYSGPTA